MELDTGVCIDCGDPRVWGYDFCQVCLDEMPRCQREGIKAHALETPSARYHDAVLEHLTEVAERAFWEASEPQTAWDSALGGQKVLRGRAGSMLAPHGPRGKQNS